jgi:hypothetical protein
MGTDRLEHDAASSHGDYLSTASRAADGGLQHRLRLQRSPRRTWCSYALAHSIEELRAFAMKSDHTCSCRPVEIEAAVPRARTRLSAISGWAPALEHALIPSEQRAWTASGRCYQAVRRKGSGG